MKHIRMVGQELGPGFSLVGKEYKLVWPKLDINQYIKHTD